MLQKLLMTFEKKSVNYVSDQSFHFLRVIEEKLSVAEKEYYRIDHENY